MSLTNNISVGLLVAFALVAMTTAPAAFAQSCTITQTLSRGSRGADVSCLQSLLVQQGLLTSDSATGFFGPLTEAAVKQFQMRNNLEPVGWAGKLTRALISSDTRIVTQPPTETSSAACTITQTLSRGSRGADVSCLQSLLVQQGLLSTDSATGFFGPLTEAAVLRFQKDNGLEPVGWAGRLTRARIASRIAGAVEPISIPNISSPTISTSGTGGTAQPTQAFCTLDGACTIDITPPTVSFTAPTASSTISGWVTISATATDNAGVIGVQFKLDGANLDAEDAASPYSISWNAASTTNGTYTLFAVARDTAGNRATSTVIVTVSTISSPNNSCSLPQKDYIGRTSNGEALPIRPFMMFSSYNLEPYTQAYIDSTLSSLAREKVPGVIYAGVGAVSKRLTQNGSAIADEADYNETIYRQAIAKGAPLWLQVEAYDNNVQVPGEPALRTVAASEIIATSTNLYRLPFRDEVKREVYRYTKYFPGSKCVVIFDEESGIYHSPQGGADFWSYPQPATTTDSEYYDNLFAERWARTFQLFDSYVKSIDPNCQVGAHLGHSVFENQPVLTKWLTWLSDKDAKPDFILYDFYLKAQSTQERYDQKLAERKQFANSMGIPMWHLAQLHTMNDFQNGLAKTPTRAELDHIVDYSRDLGFPFIGFYTKNAVATANLDDAFIPNERGQRTVFESSNDRWNYGVQRLLELGSWAFADRFDLVLYGRFQRGQYEVFAKNQLTGMYESLAIVDANDRTSYLNKEIIAIRFLNKSTYLKQGNTLELQVKPVEGSLRNGYIEKAFIVPTEPHASFRTTAALKADAAQPSIPSYTVAYDTDRRLLNQDNTTYDLCVFR